MDNSNNGSAYRTTEGVDIQATTDSGGGHNIGWTADGEWLEYTVNVTAGTYDLSLRVASGFAGPVGDVRVKLGSSTLGTFAVNNTGGWQNWQTVTLNDVALSGGNNQVLRLEMVGEKVNINWIGFAKSADSPEPGAVYYLRNRQSGTYLTGNSDWSVSLSASNTSEAQRWELVLAGSFYQLRNVARDAYLDGDSDDGVDLNSDASGDDKQWQWTSAGGTYSRFRNKARNKYMAKQNGNVLLLSEPAGQDREWELVPFIPDPPATTTTYSENFNDNLAQGWTFSANESVGERQQIVRAKPAGEEEATDQSAQLLIYPNPATDEFSIKTAGLGKRTQLLVYDVQGKQLYATYVKEGQTAITIHRNQLSGEGLYFVELSSEVGTYRSKLLVSGK